MNRETFVRAPALRHPTYNLSYVYILLLIPITSMPAAGQLRTSDAVIPHTKPNADGEDVSRAIIMRGRGPKNQGTSTSSKAIALRHGRHGIWGDGKLATFKKLSGQEKLALKAGTFAPSSLQSLCWVFVQIILAPVE